MPFTFSHPAIILPLTKYTGKHISLTGLIIGSITPDFEYFFRMKIQSSFSHTLGGLFYFDLPVGLLLAFLFHNIIRNSLYDNLPEIFRHRLDHFKIFEWNQYFKKYYFGIILSILFGAITHIIWDSFTHSHGFSVQAFPFLQNTFQVATFDIPIFKILQHLSTFVGGLFLCWTFYHLPKTSIVKRQINLNYWLILLTITFAIIVLRLSFGIDKNFIGQIIGTAVNAVLIALILTPKMITLKI